MEFSHCGVLLVFTMIRVAGLHATTLCFPNSRVVAEGQAAKITFNLQNKVSDFTVTKYDWGDDRNKRGQDIIFLRGRETCETHIDGIVCHVVNATVVSMAFPATTRNHQGRYVGMITGQNDQQFCDLNVTGPACSSSCKIQQSPPLVSCRFQHLEEMVDKSFVVKSSSGDALADCPCELNSCRCISKRRGFTWNAPVTVLTGLNNSWTAEFVMDSIINRTDYICDLFSYSVPSKTPCHFEDGERHGQSLAIATAVLSSLFLLIYLSLLIKAVLDEWQSFGEIPNTERECFQAKVMRVAKCLKQKLDKLSDAAFLLTMILSLAFHLLVCIFAIASAVR